MPLQTLHPLLKETVEMFVVNNYQSRSRWDRGSSTVLRDSCSPSQSFSKRGSPSPGASRPWSGSRCPARG